MITRGCRGRVSEFSENSDRADWGTGAFSDMELRIEIRFRMYEIISISNHHRSTGQRSLRFRTFAATKQPQIMHRPRSLCWHFWHAM